MNIAKSISEIDEKIRTVESRISTLVQVINLMFYLPATE